MRKNKHYILSITILALGILSCGNTTLEKAKDQLQTSKIQLLNTNESDCNSYYPLTKGTSFELTSYNKKGKVESFINHKIIESQNIDNGILATCEMQVSDNKGNEGLQMTYETKCQNGKYYLNLENMFSELTSQYKAQGMKISFENGISVIPNNLRVGNELEDATMIMTMTTGAMNMKMSITVSDKKVIGKETITTPAGTYDCLILTQNTTMTMGKLMNITSRSKDWISKGVGSVKSENYDKNGKLDGYTLLTKFNK